jgi:hypothetical protein
MDPIPGLEEAVEGFVAARGAAADEKALPVSRPELAKMIGPLTNAYWERVGRLLDEVITRSGDQLVFNKYERMVIDLGFIDARLVPDFGETRTDLLKELYTRTDPTHFYFSEWLAHRYRTFVLTDRMEAAPAAEAAPVAADAESQQYMLARSRIYAQLRHLFEKLPGFPPDVIEMLFSGRMDTTIAELGAAVARRSDLRAADQRRHLSTMRQRMIARARERAAKPEELTFFDGLAKIDGILESKLMRAAEEAAGAAEAKPARAAAGGPKERDPSKRIAFLKAELNLVKSLLRLGVMGSGIMRTTPVLFQAAGRTRRPELRAGLETVRECDPALPGSPNMLVAPYAGTGFYEWDRDTVFVPLTPTRGVEEAIVTALANYRLALDNLHGQGGLKRAYETRFDKEDFRTGFIRDYKNWVLGVGKGFKGRMSDEAYDFFKSYIGPRPDDLFAPADLAHLSGEQRNEVIKQARGRLNRGEGTHEDHWKLAIMYWKENRLPEASENLAAAVKLYPVDGRLMHSLGHLCTAMGYDAKAREAFNEVLNIAPNTIWHVYASDALRKLG